MIIYACKLKRLVSLQLMWTTFIH